MPKSFDETSARTNHIKLTKRTVESPTPGARAGVWYDDRLAGFGVRVMPSGRRFYFAPLSQQVRPIAVVHHR
jgi:hypothetical protein